MQQLWLRVRLSFRELNFSQHSVLISDTNKGVCFIFLCVCAAAGSGVICTRTDSSRTYIRHTIQNSLTSVFPSPLMVLVGVNVHKPASGNRLFHNSRVKLKLFPTLQNTNRKLVFVSVLKVSRLFVCRSTIEVAESDANQRENKNNKQTHKKHLRGKSDTKPDLFFYLLLG